MSKIVAIIVTCVGLTAMNQEIKADDVHLQFGRIGICIPVTPNYHHHYRPYRPHCNPHYNHRPSYHYNNRNSYYNYRNHYNGHRYNHYNRYNHCR
jgi:hypothetical protein